jgi:O-antigen ligase
MAHADTAQLAALGGALGAVLVLVAGGVPLAEAGARRALAARAALLAGLALLAATEVALAAALGGGLLDRLSGATGVAALIVGIGAVIVAAAALVRWPAVVPLAVLLAAPLRPPLSFDSSSTFLVQIANDGRLGRLLPLYFVLAAAATALGWRALRGDELRALPRTIALPAAAFFAFACCSLLWADDVEAGTNLLLFFTLPFATLLATVARAKYPAWTPRWLAGAALAMASLFAAVGLWQAATHKLFFYAPNLAASNANTDYFRVTSLFGDPSLYGRHVMLGIAVALTLLATRRWRTWPLIGLIVLMWAGLLFSYSQSSMTALLVVTLALAVATGDARIRRGVALLAAAALLATCAYVAVQVADGKSLNRITSDRTERVQDATRVIEHHPVAGVGIGGQPRASRRLAHSDRPTPNFVSHTTPLTVFAELGVIGLVLYVWLLAAAAVLIWRVTARDQTLGLALGAALLGLFVHALFYSGFLEDPLTWLVIGIAAAYCGMPAAAGREPEVAAA